MPGPLLARTLLVSVLSSGVFIAAGRAAHIEVPWWGQMLLAWRASKIAIAWYRRKYPWPY